LDKADSADLHTAMDDEGMKGDGPTQLTWVQCCRNNLQTTLACNRLLLMGSCVVQFIVSCFVVAQALHYMNNEVIFSIVYTIGNGTGSIIIICAGVIGANAVLGLFSSLYRQRSFVKVYLFLSVLLAAFQFVCAVLLSGVRNPDQLRVNDDQIKLGWEAVMDGIVTGSEDSANLLAFISEVQNDGRCCGYDSVTNQRQNPPEARCQFTDTCKSYISTYIIEQVGVILQTYCVFVAFTLADVIMLFFFVVRVVPQPVHHEDPGGMYYA